LEFPGSCRYTSPTGSELDAHKTRWTWFEEFHELHEILSEKLQASGDDWVPFKYWVAAQELHISCFEHSIELSKGPDADMTEEDWRAIWPYDVPY
jgi:hypothetical protein